MSVPNWLLICLLCASLAPAGPVVGIAAFQGPDSTKPAVAKGKEISDYISTFLGRAGMIKIVERSQRDKLVKEIEWGLSGMVEDSTAAEAGRMTGASHIIVGRYRQQGGAWKLSARLVETATGIVKGSAISDYRNEGEAVDSLSVRLLRTLGVTASVKPGYRTRYRIGYSLAGAGVALGATAVWSHLQYREADREYTSRFDLTGAEYSGLRDQAQFHQNLRWYAGASGILALAAGCAIWLGNSAEWEFASDAPGVDAMPYLIPGGAGLVWIGRF